MARLPLLAVSLLAVCVISITGCQSNPSADARPRPTATPPPAEREFRAAWVATVGNIDWPSKRGLSAEEQQREAVAILDKCVEIKLNAVVFQVRTSADALYKSDIEPWSEFLTGTQGQDPGYDPLQFWIDEAHARGVELHAWFNPFRAMYGGGEKNQATRSKDHVWNTKRNITKVYGDKLWLDPGEPEAEKQSFDVFMDVVERYDVDGIHVDDYFYPYRISEGGKPVEFPDDPSYARYIASGGELLRDDWRRENINRLMRKIYEGTKKRKPWVKFGISPFGLGRPGELRVVQGFDQYSELYADAKLWLNKGWLDYWTPQLYWKLSAPAQPYEPLLNWWISENTEGRHIWPGIFTSKIGDRPTAWPVHDVLNQVWVTQDTPGASGNVHFSMKAIVQNRDGIADALRDGPYRDHALVPASTWLDSKRPPVPANVRATRVRNLTTQPTTASTTNVTTGPTTSPGRVYIREELPTGYDVSWDRQKRANLENVWQWAVYTRHGPTWKLHVFPAHQTRATLRDSSSYGIIDMICVAAVDRNGNESKRVRVKLPTRR